MADYQIRISGLEPDYQPRSKGNHANLQKNVYKSVGFFFIPWNFEGSTRVDPGSTRVDPGSTQGPTREPPHIGWDLPRPSYLAHKVNEVNEDRIRNTSHEQTKRQ